MADLPSESLRCPSARRGFPARTLARRMLSLAGLLLGLATCGAAAVQAGPQTGWEDVPPEQLGPSQVPFEQGAMAEALFRRIWVDDAWTESGLEQTRTYYIRIKIYTAEGAQSYSQIHIDYRGKSVQVFGVSARTIQPDGQTIKLPGKAVVTESVFHRHGVDWKRASFAPPSVVPGCIIEYQYQERRFDEDVLVQTHDLQFDIPVRELSYYTNPIEAPGISFRQMIFHSSATGSSGRVGGYFLTSASLVRAYHEEPDSPPEYQQRGWMLLFYSTEELSAPETYWAKMGRAQAKWFDDFTRPTPEVSQLTQSIVGQDGSELDRAHRLADWVKHQFHTAYTVEQQKAIPKNKSVADAAARGAGTPGDADFLFAAMARAAQLDVRLYRVPSRSELFFTPNMTSPGFMRDVQIAIRIGGTWRGFDPAQRYLPWDMTCWYNEAQPGLLCDPDSSRLVDTGIAGPERNVLRRTSMLTLSDDGTLEGELELALSGQLNFEYRSILERAASATVDGLLRSDDRLAVQGLELSHADGQFGEDATAPLRLHAHVRFPGFATVTAKRILFEPAAFEAHQPARFTASSRRQPVYFRYPWSESDSITIHLPEGWRLESVDTPAPVHAEGVSRYSATIASDSTGHTLVLVRSFAFGENASIFMPVSSYSGVKQFFDAVHDRDRTTATLVHATENR